MEKNYLVTQKQIVSLSKHIMMEDTRLKKLSYHNLSYSEKKKIKKKGEEIFDVIVNYRDKETGETINKWLKRYGLKLSVPSESFLRKNIEDIEFAIQHLDLSPDTESILDIKKNLLNRQLKEQDKDFILLFHEESGEWSICNLFDNNIILWCNLINKRLENRYDINPIDYIDKYFEGREESEAAHDLLRAMLIHRHAHAEETFKKTWIGGKKNESDFYNAMIDIGFGESNIRAFSEPGNFVDRYSGIDFAIKCNGEWLTIQVKSSQADALDAIPKNGYSVFPYNKKFYYLTNKDLPAQPIKHLIENCSFIENFK